MLCVVSSIFAASHVYIMPLGRPACAKNDGMDEGVFAREQST